MGSISINLPIDPGTCAAVSGGRPTVLVPKSEPSDEPPPHQSTPNFLESSYASSSSHGLSLDSPTHTVLPPESNIYSEYDRVQKLFRTAFEANAGVVGPNSRALVPVPPPQVPSLTPQRKPDNSRSSDMVRVLELSEVDRRNYRAIVRKTRMLYNSLRLLKSIEEKKRKRKRLSEGETSSSGRNRSDLTAAEVMNSAGMWLYRNKRIIGELPGIEVGDMFVYRMELCVVGLHGQVQAGIDYVSASHVSSKEPIATSVIVSGGYEDNQDTGNVIVYTGHGGRDKRGKQIAHQELKEGNLALERSMFYNIEVRVIRGHNYVGTPNGKLYFYDGLYKVVNTWFDLGRSGFGVYKFRLLRINNQPEMGSAIFRFGEALSKMDPQLVRPGYFCVDISKGIEKVPVSLYNDVDDDREPLYHNYIRKSVFPVFILCRQNEGCACASGCMEGCLCSVKNGGDFAYDESGILVRGKPLVFECGSNCQCPPDCRNRVSQNGLKNRFEVFRSKEHRWGVRSLDPILAGAFICEYAGVVLTTEQAQIFAMGGGRLVHANRFAEKWTELGDLSIIFSDYVRPAYPAVPPLDFALDVSQMRNVASYICHSSIPNVLVQLVLHDHNNIMFPRLMLFAMENIPPMRELLIDYGVSDERTGKQLLICN